MFDAKASHALPTQPKDPDATCGLEIKPPDTFGESPNVSGKFQDLCALVLQSGSTTMGTAQGCFATKANTNNECYGFDSGVPKIGDQDGISFDASRSSSIYKSISKIQIRSCYALIIIKS